MRDSFICALLGLAFVSGCSGPRDAPTAPASNDNPAAERHDVPAPRKIHAPAGSAARSTDAAPSRGSSSVAKDFEGPAPEKSQENLDGDSGAATPQASDDNDAEAAPPDDEPAAVPE